MRASASSVRQTEHCFTNGSICDGDGRPDTKRLSMTLLRNKCTVSPSMSCNVRLVRTNELFFNIWKFSMCFAFRLATKTSSLQMILTSVRLFVNRCRNRLNVETYRFGSVPSSTIELNSTINQLISSGRHDEALRLFNSQPTLKDNRTIVLILKAATKLFDQETGIRIHQQLTSESLQNSRIQTSLIEFYSK